MREFFNLQLISAPETQNADRETDVKRTGGGGGDGSLTPDLRGWKSTHRVTEGGGEGEGHTVQKHFVHNPSIYHSFSSPD
jgi:hypothetical protein